MTVFKRGEVLLVAFPFTDLTTTKMRLALVISSNDFNNDCPDIILAAITSQIPKKISNGDHLLSHEDKRKQAYPNIP